MEEWRAVVGFEGYYEVSSLGRIRALPRSIRTAYGSAKHHPGGIMTPVADKDGYPRIMLRIDGKHHTRAVHRLVCEAFNGPPNALHREVDHIDCDSSNAKAINLRWVSRGENMARRRAPLPAPEKFSKLRAEQVLDIRSARGAIPASVIAERYGISRYTVSDIWRRKRWSSLP